MASFQLALTYSAMWIKVNYFLYLVSVFLSVDIIVLQTIYVVNLVKVLSLII